MKKEKQAYVAPITESLELRFEGMVCTSVNGENHTENFGDGGYQGL